MGKKYLETKKDSLESSILGLWQKAVEVTETNKNDKSDDGEGLDAVQPKAVKKKFKDRKDKDIDNDGDTDDSDKFLHKKRKAISKAMKDEGNAFGKALKAAKEKGEKTFVVAGKTYEVKEEVDLDDNVEEYAQTAYFKIQSMKSALAKVWGMEEGHNPFAEHKGTKSHKHPHEENEKEMVKGGKTETGKKPATIDLKPKLGESVELTEGRMKELHGYIAQGKSAKEISKIMKVDVKTIKSLMDQYETHTGDGMKENGKYMEMLAAACNGGSTSRPPGT
jgi:hypothetical protein